MAVLVLLSIILVRNLKVENPGKKQLVLETIITTFNNLFKGDPEIIKRSIKRRESRTDRE